MKTQVFLIVTFLCAGLLLSSFTTDNFDPPENPITQTLEFDKFTRHVDPNATNNNSVMADPISNYPDPFTRETTIEFTVWQPTKVSLIIYTEWGERVAVLVGQFLHEGHYRVIFDSGELRVGKYYARLQQGPVLIIEEMTKVYSVHSGLPGSF